LNICVYFDTKSKNAILKTKTHFLQIFIGFYGILLEFGLNFAKTRTLFANFWKNFASTLQPDQVWSRITAQSCVSIRCINLLLWQRQQWKKLQPRLFGDSAIINIRRLYTVFSLYIGDKKKSDCVLFHFRYVLKWIRLRWLRLYYWCSTSIRWLNGIE
jgi:hypothetical protein